MKEIIILADESNSSKKGSFFEQLANIIFQSQRYVVKGNVNCTGMEFDLDLQHKDRIHEKAIVECKAKDKLESSEVEHFAFKFLHKKYNYGYFLYTKEYKHQVAGIIKELGEDIEQRYKNLYFWDAEKVFELLEASNLIKPLNTKETVYTVTKTILLYSYFGNYYITILSNSTVPTHYSIFNAKTIDIIKNSDTIEKVKHAVKEVESLVYYDFSNTLQNTQQVLVSETSLETVAEVQESESWYDYKPASEKYFVGRSSVEKNIFDYFDDVLNHDIKSRAFYLEGKSGWGKSSLLNAIKGRCRNKRYKNKYFTFVIDSRSANSQNFIALAFNKMIEKAVSENFIDAKYSNIKIQSLYNILESTEVEALLDYLNKKNKLVIIVFDQFEDVFQKGNIFEGFYKLLLDAIDKKSNIVIGFSWKSETNIPIEHKAYHLWQQSKEFAKVFALDEFNYNESAKLVQQLEEAIGMKLDNDFIRKIVDNSQGFPWLVKKLSVHIFEQFNKGISLNKLYSQDFNVELLFKNDLEKLNGDEVKSLKFIAKRAYDNEMLDETDLYSYVPQSIRDSLLSKKMIIKSGTKYNIYWDIFRDYLVTGQAPKVGETYILRYSASSVFDILLAFKTKPKMTIQEILEIKGNSITSASASNLLRELRTLGLIIYEDNYYSLREQLFSITEMNFKEFLKDKLAKHSFYLELLKIKDKRIELADIANIIKSTVKSQQYEESTLSSYAQAFMGWIKYTGLEIPNISSNIKQSIENTISYTPQRKPKEIINFFHTIADKQLYTQDTKTVKLLYDLKSLGFLTYEKNIISFLQPAIVAKQNHEMLNKQIVDNALRTEKIQFAYEVIKNNPTLKSKEFKIEIAEILEGIKSKEYISSTSSILYEWGKYIHEHKNQI